jgi:hypothetical protein
VATDDAVITREQVMPLLMDACQRFAPRWAKIESDVGGDGERVGHVDAGEPAEHVVDLKAAGRTAELPARSLPSSGCIRKVTVTSEVWPR